MPFPFQYPCQLWLKSKISCLTVYYLFRCTRGSEWSEWGGGSMSIVVFVCGWGVAVGAYVLVCM